MLTAGLQMNINESRNNKEFLSQRIMTPSSIGFQSQMSGTCPNTNESPINCYPDFYS